MQQSGWENIKYRFQNGHMITKLIYVNVAVFILQVITYVSLWLMAKPDLYNTITSKLYLATDLKELVKQPWSLITHMFMHSFAPGSFFGGILHILFNMLWLYWFGRIFLSFQSNRQVLPIYLLGGLSGAFLMILAYNIFPVFDGATALGVGASAAVMAIVFATVVLVPNYEVRLIFFGGVKIKYIAFFILILDIISIPGGNSGGSIAHIGGAAFGALYMQQLKEGRDLGGWLNRFFDWAADLRGNLFSKRPRIIHKDPNKKTKQANRRRKAKAATKDSSSKQQKLDSILDKIGDSGYESLSSEEKEFLFKVSNED